MATFNVNELLDAVAPFVNQSEPDPQLIERKRLRLADAVKPYIKEARTLDGSGYFDGLPPRIVRQLIAEKILDDEWLADWGPTLGEFLSNAEVFEQKGVVTFAGWVEPKYQGDEVFSFGIESITLATPDVDTILAFAEFAHSYGATELNVFRDEAGFGGYAWWD